MKITITAREILNKGSWDKFCHKFGINEWAMNEGRMDPSEEFTMTLEDAREIGLINDLSGPSNFRSN